MPKTAHDVLAEIRDKKVAGRIMKRTLQELEPGDIVLSTAPRRKVRGRRETRVGLPPPFLPRSRVGHLHSPQEVPTACAESGQG
jgi:hypothetical protein